VTDASLIPPFTDEHQALRESIRSFVERELRPHAAAWEEAEEFPRELFTRMGELGFLGLKYPEEYGGQGGDYVHDAVLTEEMARCGSGGVSAGIGGHIGIATPPIFKFGTEEQKRRWLVPAIKGEKIAALAITEPGAGSDVAGTKTFARRDGDEYVVNGSKTFITNGVRGDIFVTAVKTTEAGGHHGLSFLVLERDMPGFSVSRKLEKLGWYASDTGELSFQEIRVPVENLLGEENQGFYLIMANFQWERLLMALGAVGGMEATFERTLSYAKERQAFGRPIGSFQAIRHKLAEMATLVEASRNYSYHALRLFVSGQDCLKEVSIAKLFCCDAAVKVADEAVQIHGGYGYMREYDVERYMRDAKALQIVEGTNQVQRMIIARHLAGES
jgi:acyl-CoA dehydrogenase